MREYLDNSMSYTEYLDLIDELLRADKTTGPNQSPAMVGYGRLNRQRMARLEKTISIDEPTRSAASNLDRPMIWLIITEGWCGDAAQNIPVIEKIAAESEKISTRYVLRDENPDLMVRYLTNGARSIPKLIALDANTLDVLGTWGSRPAEAQRMFEELRGQGIEKSAVSETLQRWYNADKGRSVQREFTDLIVAWAASASRGPASS